MDEAETVKAIISKVIKALRYANLNRDANDFQKDAVSKRQPLMKTVNEYVKII